MKWYPGDSKNKTGTGTTGLASHMRKRHSTQNNEAMEVIVTKEERNAPVAAAIGEESFDDKILCMKIMKINETKNEK